MIEQLWLPFEEWLRPASTRTPVEEATPEDTQTKTLAAPGGREWPLSPEHRAALGKAFETYRHKLGNRTVMGTYYRYSGLSHTIRIRGPQVVFRLSHHFAQEPPRTIEAMGHLLLRKVLRLRPLKQEVAICREAEARLRHQVECPTADRPARVSQRQLPPAGRTYDLRVLAERVRHRYFQGSYEEVPLHWSAVKAKRYWGKYFSDPPRIVINRRLDQARVPEFVIEAVLHHEYLHHHLGVPVVAGRRRVHTPQFRRMEKEFERYTEAEEFLRNFPRKVRGRFHLPGF
jgi:hypothetical protein